MSVLPLAAREPAFLDALRDCDLTLAPAGPQRWSVVLPEELRGTELRLEAGWLFLECAPPNGVGRRSAWELLQANASLDGLAKFALGPGREPLLKAELPVERVGHLAARVRAVCRGFTRAGEVLARPRGEPRVASLEAGEPVAQSASEPAGDPAARSASDPVSEPAPGGPSPSPDDGSEPRGRSAREALGALCEEAGWSFTERSRHRLMVALDVPGVFYQASVALDSRESRISVELARLDVLTALGRRALSYLLLNACGLVRLARATAVAVEDERTSVGFEVRLELPLSAVELDHALSSLSAAARLCGREVNALCAKRLAAAYLNVHEPDQIRSGSLAAIDSTQEDCHESQ